MPAHDESALDSPAQKTTTTKNGAANSSVPRIVDVESLHALAHPLRIQLLEKLSAQGPLTASRLAALTGESSGATSYHLRQLERHGFIEEVPHKGTARERWWKARTGGLSIPSEQGAFSSEVNREALALVNREFMYGHQREFAAFVEQGAATLPADWLDASTSTTTYLRVTAEELATITAELNVIAAHIADRYRRDEGAPGARSVQMVLNAFPLIQEESR
jgi:DNA-binding transcriptional ArsR family regulator